tara:strand:- start:767 stop:2080 length:1314 start_codon:yes stop_codon:yes gene_type:complete
MAIKFLSGIDLSGSLDLNKNELRNAVMHSLGTAPSNPVEGQMYWHSTDKKLYIYDATNTAWADVTGDITSVASGTGVSISGGSGGTATVSLSHLGLESLAAISSESDDGIFMYDASAQAAAYLTLSTSTGISISSSNVLSLGSIPNASLSNSSLTVVGGAGLTATAGATSLGGSTTVAVGAGLGIEVAADAVAVKGASALSDATLVMWDDTNGKFIDSPISDDGTSVTVGSTRHLIIAGNLTVSGTTTTVNSNTVAIGDNIIVLNADETGTASENAGIEIERGTDANKKFYWDEGFDSWRVEGQLIIDDVPDVSGTTTATHILTEKTAAGGDTTIEKTDVGAIGTALGLGLYSVVLNPARTNVAKTGNVYTVTHGFGTKFVQIEVVDATTYETIFVEVARPGVNTVTISFAAAVTDSAYYCMVSKVGNVDTAGDLTP